LRGDITAAWIFAGIFWVLLIGGITITWGQITSVIVNVENLPKESDFQILSEETHGELELYNKQKVVLYRFKRSDLTLDKNVLRDIADDSTAKNLAELLLVQIKWAPLFLVVYGCIALVLIFEGIYFSMSFFKGNAINFRHRKFWEHFILSSFEFHLIGCIFAASIMASYALFSFGLFVTDSPEEESLRSFWNSEVNVFSVVGFVLALTASIYAVYTKIIADIVNVNTIRLQNTVAGFFSSFNEAMDENVENSIPGLIVNAQKSIVMYLGNPVVGYFRNEDIGRKIGSVLEHKVVTHANDDDFEFKIMCWGDDKAIDYLSAVLKEKKFTSKSINPESSDSDSLLRQDKNRRSFLNGYFDKRATLYGAILSASKSEIFHHVGNFDPPFRFLIVDDRKAILWVLENPTPSGAAKEGRENRPRAGGFKTELGYMVTVLDGVFENASNLAQKVEAVDKAIMDDARKENIDKILQKVTADE